MHLERENNSFLVTKKLVIHHIMPILAGGLKNGRKES